MENEQIMKILVIIGAILILITGIIEIVAVLSGWIMSLIWVIIWIAIAAILILSVLRPGEPIPFTGIVLTLLGIIAIILALIQFVEWLALIGGILVLLAGILGLKAK